MNMPLTRNIIRQATGGTRDSRCVKGGNTFRYVSTHRKVTPPLPSVHLHSKPFATGAAGRVLPAEMRRLASEDLRLSRTPLTRHCSVPSQHHPIRVDELPLGLTQPMVDDVAARPDVPQRRASAQAPHEGCLGPAQPEGA